MAGNRTRADRRHHKDRARTRAKRFMFKIMRHDPEAEWAKKLVLAYTVDRRIGRSYDQGPHSQDINAALKQHEGIEEAF